MICPRCKKKMHYEKFYCIQGSYWAWHCIFCGEIIDPLIARNRMFSEAKLEEEAE